MNRLAQGIAMFAATAALAGCMSDVQSVMSAHGEQAVQIERLAWILFGLGAFVMAVVAAVTALAIFGSPRVRAVLARDRAVGLFGIAWPAVTLTVLLGYGLWLMRPLAADPAGDVLRIEVTGEQWWWRINYIRPGEAPVASANEIRMPAGKPVEFVLKSADVIHSFWVPSLGGKLDMIPGRTNRLRLQAVRPGRYRGQCAEFCGGPHALMAFDVEAMTPDDFAAWFEREAAAQDAPADGAAARGLKLFLSAGCGACHAVRGTAARGRVGPDLSRLASRAMIGAGILPLTQANLKRFVVAGQSVKPGNRMPEFRIFAPRELDDLGAFLASLR